MRSLVEFLLAFALLAGCRTPDERLLSLIDAEIATVCSEAMTPGRRSHEEIARIESQCVRLQEHVRKAAQ